MICPNCGHTFASGNQCPHCRLDVVLFTGTVKISDVLYNKGLARAKVNDLSGAIECLTKSIVVNKNNISARNLLGLVLYEVGHVGDALMHWVVSHSLMREKNPAAQYIDEVQKNGRVLERLSDAIRMYNQALDYIRQKSDDMAIIQLKKAVEINPKFIDALNLLTLCHLIQRDRERAAQIVDRVLSMDVNNTVALNYFIELNPSRIRPDPKARTAKAPAQPVAPTPVSYSKVTVHEKKGTNFHIAEILSFIIGAVCMFAVLYVLILPAITRENERKVNEYVVLLAKTEDDFKKQLEEQSGEIVQRDDKIESLEKTISEWTARYDIQERTNIVLHAYGMLSENKYQEAVDTLAGISTAGLASDIVEKAESVTIESYPKLAQMYLDAGKKAYDSDKDYDKALVDLEKAYKYIDDESSVRADVLFYLGSTYARDEARAEDAIILLSTLVEDYPRYRRISEAKKTLTNLEA